MILIFGFVVTFLAISLLGMFFVATLSTYGTCVEGGQVIHPNYARWNVVFALFVALCVTGYFVIALSAEMHGTPIGDLIASGAITSLFAVALGMPVLGLWARLFRRKPEGDVKDA